MAARKRSQSGGRGAWTTWLLGPDDGYRGYYAQSRGLALSFVLIGPLLVAYELMLVFVPRARRGGAGRFLFDILGVVARERTAIVFNTLLLAALLVAVIVLARRRKLRLNLIVPMVLESAAWAAGLVAIGLLILRLWGESLQRADLSARASSILLAVFTSIEAGVFEEIVFRLCLVGILFWAGLQLFNGRRDRAAVFAVVLGAVIFALCHVARPDAAHLASARGRLHALFFFVSGLYFSALFTMRGLGVAVYTHVLYDVAVLIARG
jgi:hypothetical protein